MLTGQGKTGAAVIKRRRLPGCGGVAGRAILIELGQPVVRLCRLIEIPLMTGIAGCRCPGILRGVAGSTIDLHVRTGQRKCRRGVIIVGRLPAVNGMTQRAIVRETARLVVRFGRRDETGAVA